MIPEAAGQSVLYLWNKDEADYRESATSSVTQVGATLALVEMGTGKILWEASDENFREAIRWLLDHVTGTPVVAEAPAGGYMVDGQSVTADYYRAGGLRAASFTGLPTRRAAKATAGCMWGHCLPPKPPPGSGE